jgi:hypothetical protein
MLKWLLCRRGLLQLGLHGDMQDLCGAFFPGSVRVRCIGRRPTEDQRLCGERPFDLRRLSQLPRRNRVRRSRLPGLGCHEREHVRWRRGVPARDACRLRSLFLRSSIRNVSQVL